MDGRARVKAALEGGAPDRIPRFDSFWEDTVDAWRARGLPGDADLDALFGWDMRMMYIDASMRFEQRVLEDDGATLLFQDRAGYTARKLIGKSRALDWVGHVTMDRAAWNRSKHRFRLDPQSEARIDTASYFAHMDPYPSWQEAKRRFDALRDTGAAVVFVAYGPWEGTWRHRGYTPLMMDLAEDPDWVREMAESQVNLVLATLAHALELDMRPDALFLIDDLACTRGLLFSPDIWRAVFKPLYRRTAAFLHTHRTGFWLHCCGDCRALIPDFIDCGLDVLQPLQAHAGLDVRRLKAEYGGALGFWGNIDVRKLSGPPEACEAEIRDKILAAKEGGGYMYHSDHSIPPEVSLDRYRWIQDLVLEYGTY